MSRGWGEVLNVELLKVIYIEIVPIYFSYRKLCCQDRWLVILFWLCAIACRLYNKYIQLGFQMIKATNLKTMFSSISSLLPTKDGHLAPSHFRYALVQPNSLTLPILVSRRSYPGMIWRNPIPLKPSRGGSLMIDDYQIVDVPMRSD